MRNLPVCMLLLVSIAFAAPAVQLNADAGGGHAVGLDDGGVDAVVFDDDFESGDLSAWDVSQDTDYSLSDSPGSDYLPSTDSWASFNNGSPISLSGTTSPVLTFWWYGKYFDDWDYMQVEVSTDGVSWAVVWDTISADEQTEWTEVNVDLSAYAGSSVYVRFFVHSTAVVEYDGGHYNNVVIFDGGTPIYVNSCNSMDDIATGGTNDTWGNEDEGLADQWMCAALYPYAGTYHAAGGPVYYDPDIDSYLSILDLDLNDYDDAEIEAYVNWGPADGGDILTLEVDEGSGWDVVDTIAATSGYELVTINLDAYVGQTIDLCFHLSTNSSGSAFVPLLDNVIINATEGSNVVHASWGQIKSFQQ